MARIAMTVTVPEGLKAGDSFIVEAEVGTGGIVDACHAWFNAHPNMSKDEAIRGCMNAVPSAAVDTVRTQYSAWRKAQVRNVSAGQVTVRKAQ